MLKQKIYPLLQKIKKMPYIIIYNFFKMTCKVDKKKIILASNTRKQLSGNLLYIYNYLIKRNNEYNIKIITKNSINNIFFQVKCAKEMADAKYIIIDDYFPLVYTLKRRKETKIIQVWHACGAFKKIGYSRAHNEFSKYSLTHKNYTDAIVSSENIRNNYSEAFGINIEKIHALGVPRTDLFFNKDRIIKIKEELLEKLKISKGKRVILFAPTFRGENVKKAYYPKEFLNIEDIYNSLSENDIFVIKMHPFIKKEIFIDNKYKDKIINLTDEYREINELLMITDLLITDYSSVIFEYSLLNKPIIFYVPDYEEYKNNRNFYYNFNEYMYGKEIQEFRELIENIQYNQIQEEKVNKFRETFLDKCDGNSTQRIVDTLIK